MLRPGLRFGFGMAAMLLVAEAVLRLLPVSTATMTGYHRDADVLTYPPRHAWRVATGWDLRNPQSLRSNDWGFVADHDFKPDPQAVALIGDSYVEASMLDPTDRPAAQLEALLGGQRPVYALGSPGTALLDHAQRIRLASEHFQVRDFVLLLERSDARQSLCGSGNVHSRCLDRETLAPSIERIAPPGTIKRIARHSALAQYIGGQLKFRPQALRDATFTRSTPEDQRDAAASGPTRVAPSADAIARAKRSVDVVVDAFLSDARPYLGGRLIIIVDGLRDGPSAVPDLIDIERARMIDRLRSGGAIVHDMQPVYAEHARSSRRHLEVGPYDGHLNKFGVRLAMQEAARLLQP